jgi:hypothetical protein
VRARREISVKIPAGVGDGRVRLAAQGEVGPGGGPAGDLYVEVHEQPHDIFVRDGDDLHCTVSVPMVDAALGTTVTVDAILDGRTEITIAPGTQPGSVTTLRGHGMPHLRSGVRATCTPTSRWRCPPSSTRAPGNCWANSRPTAMTRRRSSPPTPPRPATAAACSAGCGKPSAVADPPWPTLFYAEVIPTVGAVAVVDGDEGFHAATVRRIRPGERLVLSDGRGVRADCIVEAADKRRISAKVLDRQTVPRRRRRSPWCRPSPKPSAPSWRSSWPPRPGPTVHGLAGRALRGPLGRRPGGQGAAPVAGGGPLGGPPPRRAYIPEVNGPITTAALTRSWPNGSALVRWSCAA